MIDAVATEQQRLLRDDPEVAYRQYARARIETATDESTARLREDVRQVDETTSENWQRLLEKFCEDLDLRPAGAPDELSLADLETALSCLLDGIAVRQKTQPVRDGLYAKLVMALAIGFLEPNEQTPRPPMKDRFVKHMSTKRRDPRRLVKTREHWISLQKAKVEQQKNEKTPAPLDQLRPSVARALAANARVVARRLGRDRARAEIMPVSQKGADRGEKIDRMLPRQLIAEAVAATAVRLESGHAGNVRARGLARKPLVKVRCSCAQAPVEIVPRRRLRSSRLEARQATR